MGAHDADRLKGADPKQPPPKRDSHDSQGWQLATPSSIDIVGHGPNHRVTQGALIVALGTHAQGPRVIASVSGDPSIQVASAPNYLPSASQPADQAHEIKLSFAPMSSGVYRSTLVIAIPETGQRLEVPIVAHSDSTYEDKPAKPAAKPRPASHQLDLPTSVDLGEQVVGSHHRFPLAHVLLREPGASVRITSSIAPVASVSSRPQNDLEKTLGKPGGSTDDVQALDFEAVNHFGPKGDGAYVDASTPGNLEIGFAPSRKGESRAIAHLFLNWSDGAVTERLINVKARGRGLEDAPKSGLPERVPDVALDESDANQEHKAPTNRDEAENEFTFAANQARDAAHHLADMQSNGVGLAEEEVESFLKPVPPTPLWASLIEIAISMGIAGVAGVVARQLASRLGSSIIARSGLDPKKVKPGDLKLVVGVTDAIKEGLKTTGKKNAPAPGKNTPKASTPTNHGPAADPNQQDLSSNKKIDFFGQQRSRLATIAHANRTTVTDEEHRLRPVLKSAPPLAVTAMSSLAEALRFAADEQAAREQALATESQWIVGVARGKEPAHGPNQDTHLDAIRAGTWASNIDGFLRIAVTLKDNRPVTPSDITVNNAVLEGVSQEIADRLWKERLEGIRIPILIRASWKEGSNARSATITRDEAGRVRIDGNVPGGNAPYQQSEPEKILAATAVVDGLFGKSLEAWGLPQIKTNDATGREK